MNTELQQGPINTIGWILVFTAACAFVAAAVGLVLVSTGDSRQSAASVTEQLHDTYYIVRHTRHAIWPLAVIIIMSVLIAVGGYMHTDRHMNRVIQRHMEKLPGL